MPLQAAELGRSFLPMRRVLDRYESPSPLGTAKLPCREPRAKRAQPTFSKRVNGVAGASEWPPENLGGSPRSRWLNRPKSVMGLSSAGKHQNNAKVWRPSNVLDCGVGFVRIGVERSEPLVNQLREFLLPPSRRVCYIYSTCQCSSPTPARRPPQFGETAHA